ncbi:MATE family efflux transporter [Spongiibacter nanhainus]|uniref:MATE family efflux transporter n=1 Tax=Spongiibacter nanhainus TaxID=2794344 RepID=A0A7T4R0V4_9GAMM|nr:MATE family efflux transporter [Spongiibacter nanhainus]QQD18343.1 MATE family efflux transporter [Spongiibacter nanhainus]
MATRPSSDSNITDNRDIPSRLWSLAWPMILGNLSVPLLGLVDTAVLGHLDDSRYLSAVAIGTSLLAFLYWGFGFLRMGTTGAAAQASQREERSALLFKAMVLALIIATGLLALGPLLISMGLAAMDAPGDLHGLASSYLSIRLFSAPAVLVTYCMVGWLVGRQQTRWPLIIALVTNLSNIFLDLLFVVGFGWQSDGAALASVIAEYSGLGLGLYVLRHNLADIARMGLPAAWRSGLPMGRLIASNRHLFIRTAALLFSFAFFTAQGTALGQNIVAANAILIQLVLAAAYGMDGFAHATEGLVGEAWAEGNRARFLAICKYCFIWCGVSALVASTLLWLGRDLIVQTMTDLPAIRELAQHYFGWVVLIPLISVTCYVLDGIFIGVMASRAMQWCMLFSVVVVYLPCWWLTQPWGNQGLWLAFAVFHIARGLSLAVIFPKLPRQLPATPP